ncbi:MAG: SurA N-terminal domain-containing protein [Flavobacteriales bacterium]|nr:SurA N-terminal domain-containing protein [Flavobacteriales bacterium]
MAVIGKIREKSGLVMIIIGVGMLAFLLPLDQIQRLFGGGPDNSLGDIGGKEITAQEFDVRFQNAVANYENQQNQTAPPELRESLKEQVWNDIIREEVLESQYKELGIAVSPKELFDMVQGNDPHPQVKQAFADPTTGAFSPTQVLQFLKSLETMPAANRAQWLAFEEGIEKERIASKYQTLLSKGLYPTSNMVKRAYVDQNEQRNIKFVAKRYNSVNDSTVTVSEKELKAYYDEHKSEYKQDPSRDVEYVKFEVIPSEADIAEAKEWIDATAAEFKITEDDSSFVAYNSEAPLDELFYGAGAMPFGIDSSFFDQEVGSITAVYEQNGAFMVTKLSKIKMVPDSVRARHILLKTTQINDTLLEAKLDSIKTAIELGANFAEIAKTTSEDVGSAIEGGDLGWFVEGAMVPTFNDACFNGQVGDMVIVQSQFGFHLIEIMKQADKSRKVQLSTVVRKNIPSKETFNDVFAIANMFCSTNSTAEAFIKATETDEYSKFIAANIIASDKGIPGMEDVRDLVRWSFKNEKGSISEAFQFGNTFVVAHLSEVREEGTATMDQVEIQVELGAKKKKKASMFIEEMKGIASLDELATKTGEAVSSVPNVNFSAYSISGMGQELRVNGMISTLQKGQMSVPIEGQTGVFVVLVESVTPAPENGDYELLKTQLTQQNSTVSNQLLEALKDKFGVVDNRYKFY